MKSKLIISYFTFFFCLFTFLHSRDTWIQTYQPFGDDVSYFVEDIRVCPDEGYAVIGSIWDNEFFTNDGFMMKTDIDGNFLWASIDTVSFISGPEPSGFVVLENGSFITVGNDLGFGNSYLLKRTPDGIIEWTVQLDDGYRTEAIELTNDGNIVSTGGSMDGSINLQKFDLNASLIWRETYLPAGYEFGGGYSVTQTSDGGYTLTGSLYGVNYNDIVVIKTNVTGDSLWTWIYDGYGLSDRGNCVIETNDNYLLIGGYLSAPTPIYDYGLVTKLNSSGDTLWVRHFDRVTEITHIKSIHQTMDNNYILRSGKLLKIDENQNIIWDSYYDYGLSFGYASGDHCFEELENEQFICVGRKTISYEDFIIISKTSSEGNVTAIDEFEIPSTNEIMLTNYPNPFNPTTTIYFETTNLHENTQIEIYNIKGQMIKHFSDIRNQTSVVWDGKDQHNIPVSSGIYLYRIKTDDGVSISKKMLLLR